MTIAQAPARRYARSGRVGRYRPTPDRPFPSLGWLWLEWTYAFLPSPADEKAPLIYTDEQARRIIEWGRLNPRTGAFVHSRRMHLQEAKGYGKSPKAGSLGILEFRGPVCFDGWDADGQPVGVPWGTGERPSPWIQVAAVSEGQTMNTWSALYSMLAANGAQAAEDLRIDLGKTRILAMDDPAARLEPVTASAGSREGQRITAAIMDEPQLWTPSNDGHLLARTILDNLAKMGGRAIFTGNAYEVGAESVAELFDLDEPGVLRYGRRPSATPNPDWPRARLLASLREVYADAWWIDLGRILDDALSPTADWERAKRLFWNLPSSGAASRWIPDALWDDAGGVPELDPRRPTYAAVFVAPDRRSAWIAVAQQDDSAVRLRVRAFPADALPEGELVQLAELEAYLGGLRAAFPAYVTGRRRTIRGREVRVPMHGPEIAYNGSFFEGTAQRLRRAGAALVDEPQTRVRLGAAAGSLKAATLEGRLVHDGGVELAEQIAQVDAEETETGWVIESAGPGARAAMFAVHRAMNAPKAPARTMRRGGPPR